MYLVVAFHAGLGLVSGGYIGVDVFFVLSGYLVTSILVRDLASRGRIRVRQFYARRVRRILPAAVVALFGTALAYSVVASPAELLDALGGFRAAFLYVANWYFIGQANDYFAADVNNNPVLQFWSLAVEEQFYLVWPLLFGGLYAAVARIGRWRWWAMRIAVVVAGAASAIAAVHLSGAHLARAYYGTDTRAYQLLAGAALALTPQLVHLGPQWARIARWVSALALFGLLTLASSAVELGPISRGVFVALLATVLLVALENASGGLTSRVLSSGPFTYLGRISYGVYLWHWPVIVIAAHGRDLSPITLFALSCVIATGLAAVSFRLVEQPIRMSRMLDRYRTPVIAIGFTASILFGIFAIPAMLDPGRGSISALPGTDRSSSGASLLDWRVASKDIPDMPDCLGVPVRECTVVPGPGSRVVLMGDSNARMWIPALAEIAEQRSWNLSVAAYPTCPWQRGIQVLFPTREACRAHQRDWYERVIPTLDPDVIFLAHAAYDSPARSLPFVDANGDVVREGDPAFARTLRGASAAAIRALRRPGREIVILEPTPDGPIDADPLSCLSLGRPPAKCAYTANRRPTPLEQFYRREARRPDVTTLDVDRVVCPRWPTCDPIVDDIIVKRDRNHLTATYSRAIADQIGALLPR